MTANRSFKRRVRERMDRTGERYTTARAHLLAQHRPAAVPGLLPGWSRTGGLQPDLAATANALAHVGVRRPDGEPIDEIDVLGLSGGIGFMYAVFEWQGHGPTLTLTTRTDSMPDATVAQALARAGAAFDVRETTGAPTAARHLDDAFENGRVALASVDEAALPHRADATAAEGGLPRVVGVIGRTGDDWLVDDQDPDPVAVPADTLTAARSAARSRHRLVVLGDPLPDHGHRDAVRAALVRTVADYDTPPARPFASNVGTAGLRKWATLLTATGARSWAQVFDRPEHRQLAYDRVRACIDEDLTAPGAGRGLWATFVDRAADLLDLPALDGIAEAARAAEGLWTGVAATAGTATPDDDAERLHGHLAALVEEIATRERTLLDELAGVLATGR